MSSTDPAAVPAPDVAEVLESSGLRYSTDRKPGWRREGEVPAFRYVDDDGRVIDDERALARVARLAIPPAWTGRVDLRGPARPPAGDGPRCTWSQAVPLPRALAHASATTTSSGGSRRSRARCPRSAAPIERDLALPGLPRAKVLAAMVALLDRTAVRVGDERYRRENGTYGLTTLRNRHASVNGESLRLRFKGKAGKEHDITLDDRRLARDRPPLQGPAGLRAVPVRGGRRGRATSTRATSTRT